MPEIAFPPAASTAPQDDGIIKLAVLAVGGQGGGVLADWITDVAERNGYLAQSTSVAGVAQRTGATIYYVEMCRDNGRRPVFALSPAQGDVDILIAAELMEAGRAIMRGFVTPERTTLIASSHRIAAVSEKIEPGDGRASSEKVRAAAESASKRFIAFDMERIAAEAGSMISASLLGALAGSGALPFPRESYEQTIAASGRGIKASLTAFAGAFERARGGAAPAARPDAPEQRGDHAGALAPAGTPDSAKLPISVGGKVSGPAALLNGWQALTARVDALPEPVRDMASRGLKKVVDYQDLAYGSEYLDRLDRAVALDDAEHGYRLSIAAAKHVANAMCYDDMIRVADLKTRSTRGARVRREVGVERRRRAAGDRIFPPAHRGILRHHAGAARPLHRGAAEACRLSRPPHQSRPPHPHRRFCRLCNAVAGRRHAPLAPRPAAPPGGSQRISSAGTGWRSTMSPPTMGSPSRSSTAGG